MQIRLQQIALVMLMSYGMLQGQSKETHTLPPFDQIKTGPRIVLVLEEGASESLQLELEGIAAKYVNYEVRNGKLQIYLDNAKNLEPKRKIVTNYGTVKESIYTDAKVTAYITYRNLNKLIMKGDEDARIEGTVSDETFKLKVFGDSDIAFENLNTQRLKVKMFGDCQLSIEHGQAERQKYAIFGDHLIDTAEFPGRKVKVTSFGDAEFRMNAEELKVTVLGTADINCPMDTRLRKFVLGESSVRRFNE